MSDFDSNPFADPEIDHPFQDPSVTQVRQAAPRGLEDYNPFTDAKPVPPGMAPKAAVSTQPAIMKPTDEPPAYTQSQEQSGAAAELLRRQEELERKAAELDRREREMQSLSASGGRNNNWPPLPEKFPVGPCFYHDIAVDIPVEFQKTVKIMYYLWMLHTGTLLANVFGCLAWFCVSSERGVDFGLSILWFLLFTPCSFVCWYRPLYGAFRSDSSFRFFAFFFVYICQVGIYVIQCIGISSWGTSGWISALIALNRSVPVGIIMILIAALFTAEAVLSLIMLKKVHGMYRTTGASFAKAQQEFATGVMTNKTVQTAAATAASRAAQGGFKEQI
ncbi:secretory carrier-associated membrane protein 1 isoform X1 [Gasterosteus aculeatus]|uniref:secretory carrier-associated membrane protein 1-like isoform X1 n=1 Tax=Gasterosteus aculeatus aculeatus TaxID=481459 RepID=UPI001A98C02A|nr:secretory carrier-associated membrane protein 1-like isoform X1 [Gasterosteus aculeatus aculeatus]